jgi:hypothetical protein
MNLLVIVLILLLLLGGGGFYIGGPAIGGGGLGLVLIICIIVYAMGGFRKGWNLPFMINLIKFTEESFPNGYSRKDCMDQLAKIENRLTSMRFESRGLADEAEKLNSQLIEGGRTE